MFLNPLLSKLMFIILLSGTPLFFKSLITEKEGFSASSDAGHNFYYIAVVKSSYLI